MRESRHIVYVGHNGFPVGMAQVARQRLIAKGLIAAGCDVVVISRYGVHDVETAAGFAGKTEFEGVPFLYASGSAIRESSFLRRTLFKIRGLISEMRIIFRKRRNSELGAILVTTNSFHNLVIYKFISIFSGTPMIIDNVEHWTSIPSRKGGISGVEDWLYDHFGYKICDRVICISDFLADIVKKGSPGKPVIKIPTIVDFSKFEGEANSDRTPYFLFCGSAVYFEVIDFVVNSFEKLDNEEFSLYLVCSGPVTDMVKLQNRLEASPKNSTIKLFSRLEFSVLVQLYRNSRALMIPLRNTAQDLARFPHKIGEYCAAGRVILSTNLGEVKNYFTDGENALLAPHYYEDEFSAKMQEVIDNPMLAEQLGNRSYQTGKENFDHIVLGKKLSNFIFPN